MKFIEGSEEVEVYGQRKSTKDEIETWIDHKLKKCGLDWRVGFMVKFRDYPFVYVWRWIKDNTQVSTA